MSGTLLNLFAGIGIAFASSGLTAAPPKDAASLLDAYTRKHTQMLRRYAELENRVDGLTPDFRRLLGDRKTDYEAPPELKPNQLPDKLLAQVVITERKRLEAERVTLKQWQDKPFLLNSYLRKMAAALLRLETSEVLLSFVEYVDAFNRGDRPFPYTGAPKNRTYFLRLGAATMVGLDYTAYRKSQMAFSNSWILGLNPNESKETLALLEQGLGPFTQDAITLAKAPGGRNPAEETQRLVEGQKILALIDKLTAAFIVVNKSYADEYQYHLLKLRKAVESQKK